MKIRQILSETGLEFGQLRKHGGKYFNILMKKIENGDTLEVEPSYAARFPDGVVIDPAIVPTLKAAFYANGDPDNMVTDVSNNVIAANPQAFRMPLPTTVEGQTVPLGAITKTPDFKPGDGLNYGIIAEGVLGAALTAKFIAKGEEIGIIDVGRILGSMTPEPIGKSANSVVGTYNGTIQHDDGGSDDITFILKLSKNEFSPLVGSLRSHEALDPKILGLMRSAINYVNSDQEGIAKAIQTILDSKAGNKIDVISDGVSHARSTKADLILRINNEVIKLISLKAMGVKQFGQASGHKFENIKTFLDDMFDVDIGKRAGDFKDTGDPSDVRHNHSVISDIYRKDLAPQVNDQLQGGDNAEASFIVKLANGIIKHATGDDELDLVKFDRGIKGGYKVLRVDRDLIDKMKKTKFKVEVKPDKAVLRIYGKTSDPELREELGTDDWVLLLQLRSQLQQTANYVRNILEMGDLLEALTTVKAYTPPPLITPPQQRQIKRASKGRITSPGERDVRDPSVPDIVALGRRKKPVKK